MKLENFDIDMLKDAHQIINTFVNPFSYYLLMNSFEEETISEFNLFVDGISLVRVHNTLYSDSIRRFSFDFTSLAPIVFNYCSSHNHTVAIVGGDETEIENAVKLIKSRYRKLNIVFYSSGFFDINSNSIYETLKGISPDFILSGMGTPRQERFILNCKDRGIDFKFAFTCGGFISQISSKEDYFSPFFNRLNLRWLQRFYRHSYVRKRVLFDYPVFFAKYFKSYIGKKI